MNSKFVWQAVNFLQIYIYSVLIWSTVLHHLNITAGSNPALVACLGISVGIGLTIIEKGNESFRRRRYDIKEALWLALIAPFEIRKLI